MEIAVVLRRQQKRCVVAGRAGIEESRRAKARYVCAVVAGGALSAVPQKGCGIKRQQNRDAACSRFRKNLRGRVVEPDERISRGRVSRFAGRGLLLVERGQRRARRVPVHVNRNNARARHHHRRRGRRHRRIRCRRIWRRRIRRRGVRRRCVRRRCVRRHLLCRLLRRFLRYGLRAKEQRGDTTAQQRVAHARAHARTLRLLISDRQPASHRAVAGS